MNGEYKEELPYGVGDLIVKSNAFSVRFYFPGPDMRYSGDFFTIEEKKIDNYIEAYHENWQKYLNFKKMKAQLGNEFSTKGILDMTINIGGFHEGVCIYSYHMPIRTEEDLKKLIDSFLWAKEKGPKVLELLKSL